MPLNRTDAFDTDLRDALDMLLGRKHTSSSFRLQLSPEVYESEEMSTIPQEIGFG